MATRYADYAQRHLYKRHSLGNGYTVDPGVFILPLAVAEPTTEEELKTFVPFVTVTAHAPILYRTTPFDTVKEGGPPKVPAPADTGTSVFVGGSVFIHGPQINSNCWTSTWEVEGEYAFAVAAPVSVELQNGLLLGSLPFPTITQQGLTQAFNQGATPSAGSLVTAGADAKACYSEAQSVNFGSDFYAVRGTTIFPGVFFDSSMLNGDTIAPQIT